MTQTFIHQRMTFESNKTQVSGILNYIPPCFQEQFSAVKSFLRDQLSISNWIYVFNLEKYFLVHGKKKLFLKVFCIFKKLVQQNLIVYILQIWFCKNEFPANFIKNVFCLFFCNSSKIFNLKKFLSDYLLPWSG